MSWHVVVDCGDGSTPTTQDLATISAIPISHLYAGAGSYTVTIRVTNDDLTLGTATIAVTVSARMTPAVSLVASNVVYNGQAYSAATARVTAPNNVAVTSPGVTYMYYAAAAPSTALPGAPRYAGSHSSWPATRATACTTRPAARRRRSRSVRSR